MKHLFQLLPFLLLALPLRAATINAASPSQADVQAAINLAVEGDTVSVPAGTSTWTGTVTIGTNLNSTKGITLRGAGAGVTTILDQVPLNGYTATLLVVYASKITPFRLTGFTFGSVPGYKVVSGNGKVRIAGNGVNSFRVDRNEFEIVTGDSDIYVSGQVYGVIDHNTFTGMSKAVFAGNKSLVAGVTSDNSWNAPLSLGSANALFMEDNVINKTLGGDCVVIDAESGANIVIRHNVLEDATVQSHGTESTGRFRGLMSYEIYDNVFQLVADSSMFDAIFIRGGTGVIFNNVLTGNYTNIVRYRTYRLYDGFAPWGGCFGNNPWDLNDGIIHASGVHDGSLVTGGVLTDTTKSWTTDQWQGYSIVNLGVSLDTGTHTGSSASASAIDSTKTWTTNQWKGYYVRNLRTGLSNSVFSNTATKLATANIWETGDQYEIIRSWGSVISSNAGQTLTAPASAYGRSRTWTPGDRYQVLKPVQAFDQVGVGTSDLLTGYESGNMSPVRWLNQSVEPAYSWNNTKNGVLNNEVSKSNSYIKQMEIGVELMPGVSRPGYAAYIYPNPLTLEDPATPDTTAPTLSSTTIENNGTTVTLVFSENVVSVNSAHYAISSGTLSASAGSGPIWTMTLTPAALSTDAARTLSYTAGTTVDTAASPNSLANFSGAAVTNNSIQTSLSIPRRLRLTSSVGAQMTR